MPSNFQPIAGPGGDPGARVNNNGAVRGKYEAYNQYLDKLEQEREARKRQEGVPAKGGQNWRIANQLVGPLK